MATEHRPTWSKTHPVYSAKHTQKTCVHEKHFLCNLERFSIDWCKTKTKIIITVSWEEPFENQWELEVKTSQLPKARENAGDQVVTGEDPFLVVIGFGFAFDWLREWREFSRPITEQRKAKPIESRIAFDTQFRIAPNSSSSYASKKIFGGLRSKCFLSVSQSQMSIDSWSSDKALISRFHFQGSSFETLAYFLEILGDTFFITRN